MACCAASPRKQRRKPLPGVAPPRTESVPEEPAPKLTPQTAENSAPKVAPEAPAAGATETSPALPVESPLPKSPEGDHEERAAAARKVAAQAEADEEEAEMEAEAERMRATKKAQEAEAKAREASFEAQQMALAMAEVDADESDEEGVPPTIAEEDSDVEEDIDDRFEKVQQFTTTKGSGVSSALPFGGSVTFDEEGPLGIRFKKLNDTDTPVIAAVNSGTQAASHLQLRPGLVLVMVEGVLCKGKRYEEVVAMLRNKSRPLQLTFSLADSKGESAGSGSAALETEEKLSKEQKMLRQKQQLRASRRASISGHEEMSQRAASALTPGLWSDGGRWKTDPQFPAFDDLGRNKDSPEYGLGTPLAAMLPARRKMADTDLKFAAAEMKMKNVVEAQAALRHEVATLMRAGNVDFLMKQMPTLQSNVKSAEEAFKRSLTAVHPRQKIKLENKLKDLLFVDEAAAQIEDDKMEKKPTATKKQMAKGVMSKPGQGAAGGTRRPARRYSVAVGGAKTSEGFDLELQMMKARANRPGGISKEEPVQVEATFAEKGPIGIKWLQWNDHLHRDVACVKSVAPGSKADLDGKLKAGMLLGYINGEWIKDVSHIMPRCGRIP